MSRDFRQAAVDDRDSASPWYLGDYSEDVKDVLTGRALLLASIANSLIAAVPDREFEIRRTALLAAASNCSRETPEEGFEDHHIGVIETARYYEAYLRGESA